MARDYNEITGEIDAIRKSNRTLSFIPNFELAPLNCFKELITGKVKIGIYDFTAGKGDNALWGYFNLELSDFKYLYERAKISHLPEPMYRAKIIGNAPQKGGQFNGLCPSYRLTIKRTPFSVKDGKQIKMNSPWSIEISNGYGKALPGKLPGTFYEASGSYKGTVSVKVNLTDEEFLDRFETIHAYMTEFRRYAASKLLVPGLSKLEETRKRNTYDDGLQNQTTPAHAGNTSGQGSNAGYSGVYQEQTPNTPNTPSAQTQSYAQNSNPGQSQYAQPQVQSQPQTQPQPSAVNQPQRYRMMMVITSEFQALEGGVAIANCMMGGKEYPVYFRQITDNLVSAKNNRSTINAFLYCDDENRICFDSIAA